MTNKENHQEKPEFVLIFGGVCSGKTTHRKNKYSEGYTILDASDIFIELSKGAYYDFPSHLETQMEQIGLRLVSEALSSKRNIVTEIIGADYEIVKGLIDLMKTAGYDTKIDYIECSMYEAWQRNISRGNDTISAYYCEPYHIRWLSESALALRK